MVLIKNRFLYNVILYSATFASDIIMIFPRLLFSLRLSQPPLYKVNWPMGDVSTKYIIPNSCENDSISGARANIDNDGIVLPNVKHICHWYPTTPDFFRVFWKELDEWDCHLEFIFPPGGNSIEQFCGRMAQTREHFLTQVFLLLTRIFYKTFSFFTLMNGVLIEWFYNFLCYLSRGLGIVTFVL